MFVLCAGTKTVFFFFFFFKVCGKQASKNVGTGGENKENVTR